MVDGGYVQTHCAVHGERVRAECGETKLRGVCECKEQSMQDGESKKHSSKQDE